MQISKNLFLLAFVLSLPWYTVAEVRFVQSKSGVIVEVPMEKVPTVCGKNFFFRETKKEEVPEYLYKEIIRAAFNSEMLPSFDLIISSLKSNSGKCAWLTPEELIKAK